MTTDEPVSKQEPATATAVAAPSSVGRIVEWFWRAARLEQAQRELKPLDEREVSLAQRARASAQIAQQVLMPEEPTEAPVEGSAAELFRQSAYWSLCALSASSSVSPRAEYDSAIWEQLDESLLAEAAEGERVEHLRGALRGGSFVYFAELAPAEQAALALELRSLAQALLGKLAARARLLDAIYLQRTWRLAALGLVVLALAGGVLAIRQVIETRNNLATSASWVASSKFDTVVCTSPAQQCGVGYFFHTNEERNPWVEFDLQKEHDISKVQVDNRTDCCAERADPLVVEVSSDHVHWKSVARHSGEFSSWTASFKTVSARWLRVRLNKTGYFHLSRVGIFG